MKVEVYTLGRFQIRRSGQSPELNAQAQTRPMSLLKLLIASDGEIRSILAADTLWPDADGAQAANVLKVTLNRLRKIVGKDVVLQSAGHLSLDRDLCWVDKWTIDKLLSESISNLNAGETAMPPVDTLLELYQGDFLPEDSHMAWVLAAQEQTRSSFLFVISRYVRILIDQKKSEQAIIISLHMLKIYEHAVVFYAHLIRAYDQLGFYDDSSRLFWQCKGIWSDLTPFLNRELIESFAGSQGMSR